MRVGLRYTATSFCQVLCDMKQIPVAAARGGTKATQRLRLRSFHSGFSDSIKAIFLDRRHFLISFSREIAERALAWGSNQTRLVTLYFFVKPGRIFSLCWPTR